MNGFVRYVVVVVALAGCGSNPSPEVPRTSAPDSASTTKDFPDEEGAYKKFHSKRFLLSLPLPGGKSWRIDDHSNEFLVAAHDPTKSKITLLLTREDELVGRTQCEARARDRGWVPAALATVEDRVTIGPEAFDTRVWVAVGAKTANGELEGHVFAFGGYARQCLLFHLVTYVPSANEENVLASRLATARARIAGGLTIDPLRITGEATVPREPAPR